MINIIEIKNKLGNGCTDPYIVWCDDGNTYVVKFPGNIQGKKALVNEFIASKISDYLNLPILKYSLINVTMSNYKDTMKDDIKFVSGTAFGTLYDDNALTILNAGAIAKSKNKNEAIKILIFDLLMGNYDRNKGNLLINSITKMIIMIDHTHIFGLGTIWDESQLNRLTEQKFDLNDLHQFNCRNIIESLKFDDEFFYELNTFIKRVKDIKRSIIESIMKEIPSDWNVTIKEKKLLTDYIEQRFKRVDEILEILDLKGGGNSEK